MTVAEEQDVIRAFSNFLSWGERPSKMRLRRDVPPAWFAYAIGATKWCPPAGEW